MNHNAHRFFHKGGKIKSPKNDQSGRATLPPLLRQQRCATANVKLLFHAWWLVFSLAALFQIVLWPDAKNIICVLLAWTSSILTGAVILKGRVTFQYPWSSVMVLMFCLTNCALPLVFLSFQGDPLTYNLEVPVATFSHLLICQIVLLLIHAAYRNLGLGRSIQVRFRNKVLQPFGFFRRPNFSQSLIIGFVGLAASAYVYMYIRDHEGGALAVTGSIPNKIAQGFSPLSYTPFLMLLPLISGFSRAGGFRSLVAVSLYSLPLLVVAMGRNGRSYAFMGIATVGMAVVLLLLSGQIRIAVKRVVILGGIGLLIVMTVGSDLAIAMRVARQDRMNLSSVELVKETIRLLTVDRQQLERLRRVMQQGSDTSEAWYVTNPVFSRFVNTHFEDRALAIGLTLQGLERATLWNVEIEKVLGTLPNPLLKRLGVEVDKDEVEQYSMGDWMLYLGGRTPTPIGGMATGGIIGDGYAAYGWWYLVPFGMVALVLFMFSDSLYNHSRIPLTGGKPIASGFAVVGLINGYALAMVLNSESISALISFTLRQPIQWLVLYGAVYWIVRRVTGIFAIGGAVNSPQKATKRGNRGNASRQLESGEEPQPMQ